MGKLAGIRVVDLTLFLPGPMMTLMMADEGAAVTKVEPPGGDPARAMPPFGDNGSLWFDALNRGKSCVALDLKSDAGKAALWDLIDDADVVVEGFRPGAMARLGFDYATVAARRPSVVYCSISAFGQTGPRAHHPAHDLAVQALSGFLSVNDGPGGPVVPGVPAADVAAGLTALSAVLMALIGRATTGRGDYVDISMFGSLLPWSAHIAADAMRGGAAPRSAEQRSLGGAAFYQVYACKDGGHVTLGGREGKFVRELLEALGRPDLVPLGDAPAGAAQAPLRDYLAATFMTRSRDEWTAWFEGRDVAFAPVLDFSQAFAAAADAILDGRVKPAIRFGAC